MIDRLFRPQIQNPQKVLVEKWVSLRASVKTSLKKLSLSCGGQNSLFDTLFFPAGSILAASVIKHVISNKHAVRSLYLPRSSV